MEEISSGG